jgi:hypothetical protein
MNILESLNNLLPEYETVLPFSNQLVSFTPFKVKDAKTLTIILQENNKKLALKAMVDLLKSCSKNTNIEDLCLPDAEYLFLQIRSKSVDEVLNLMYKEEKIQVNISEIKGRNSFIEEQISIGSDVTLVLSTPSVKKLLQIDSLNKDDLYKACIEKIIVRGEIYNLNKFVTNEIKELINNLPLNTISKLELFWKKQPELYLSLPSKDGEKEVSGLLNFFTYR